jgi:hypothetical protein
MVSPLVRSNAAQWRTHIRRRNRRRSDGAVAAVRSAAAALRVLATWSSFDNPFRACDCSLARFIPFPLARSLCWKNWDSGICDSHHVLEPLPLNKSLSLDRFGQQQDRAFQILTRELVNDQTLVAFSNVRFWA